MSNSLFLAPLYDVDIDDDDDWPFIEMVCLFHLIATGEQCVTCSCSWCADSRVGYGVGPFVVDQDHVWRPLHPGTSTASHRDRRVFISSFRLRHY